MGYTHYMTQKKSFTKDQWAAIQNDARLILAKVISQNIPLQIEYDNDAPPCIDSKLICFNGAGEDGHESFIVRRVRGRDWDGGRMGWSFCKTARKPYDIAVTAILAYLETTYPDRYSVSSDGEADDWRDGVHLARAALPHLKTPPRLPADIAERARFSCTHHETKHYQIVTTHDEWLAIERKADKALIKLPFGIAGLHEFNTKLVNRGRAVRLYGTFRNDEFHRNLERFLKLVWKEHEYLLTAVAVDQDAISVTR